MSFKRNYGPLFLQIETKSNNQQTHTHTHTHVCVCVYIYMKQPRTSMLRGDPKWRVTYWPHYGIFHKKEHVGHLVAWKNKWELHLKVGLHLGMGPKNLGFITPINGLHFWTQDWTQALSLGAVFCFSWDQPTNDRREFEHNPSRSQRFQVQPVTCWHLLVFRHEFEV